MRELPKNVYTELNFSNMRVSDLENLKIVLNGRTIDHMIAIQKLKRPFVCPKCEGKGYNETDVNLYPAGLPDSGWVDDIHRLKLTCSLCDGHGYTEKEYMTKVLEVEYVEK